MGLKPVSTTEIINTIKSLNDINSHGNEKVSTQLLKIDAPCRSHILGITGRFHNLM